VCRQRTETIPDSRVVGNSYLGIITSGLPVIRAQFREGRLASGESVSSDSRISPWMQPFRLTKWTPK
jgi:hypothetical protein